MTCIFIYIYVYLYTYIYRNQHQNTHILVGKPMSETKRITDKNIIFSIQCEFYFHSKVRQARSHSFQCHQNIYFSTFRSVSAQIRAGLRIFSNSSGSKNLFFERVCTFRVGIERYSCEYLFSISCNFYSHSKASQA